MASYKANKGISTSDKRIEEGDIFDAADLPASSIKWLVEQGIAELVPGTETQTTGKKAKRSTPVEPVGSTADEGEEF